MTDLMGVTPGARKLAASISSILGLSLGAQSHVRLLWDCRRKAISRPSSSKPALVSARSVGEAVLDLPEGPVCQL